MALGDGDVLMLRNHGPLVIGTTARECFSRMYYLERACRMQIATLSACRDPHADLIWPDPKHCSDMALAFEDLSQGVAKRERVALIRMLDQIDGSYMD